jgi:hypothetical protein
VVYRGWWHKVPVAAKVMPARNSEHEALQVATEMAVLSTVHHPNIVSVYSCLTDMIEAPGAGARALLAFASARAQRPARASALRLLPRAPGPSGRASFLCPNPTKTKPPPPPLSPRAPEMDAGKSIGATMLSEMRTRYRRLRPNEDLDGDMPTYNIVVRSWGFFALY